MAVLGNTGVSQNPTSPDISEGLLKQIMEKLGVNWAKFFDCIPKKMLWFQLSLPEYDKLGIFSQMSKIIPNILFSGKFNIKCREDTNIMQEPNVNTGMKCNTFNSWLEDEVFGRLAFKENLRRHFQQFLILGNMQTSVGRDPSNGKPTIRFNDGLSAFPIVYDETHVDSMCSIMFKYVHDITYVVATADNGPVRTIDIYQTEGESLSQVNWGTPEWYQVAGDIQPIIMGNTEVGHCKSQWWRLPTEDSRIAKTPYTNGMIFDLPRYREVIKCYLQWKKEKGWKLPMMFYNRAFDTTQPASTFVSFPEAINKQRANWESPSMVFGRPNIDGATNSDMFLGNNNYNGMWPNTDSFMSYQGLLNGLNTDYSPANGIKRGDSDCVCKTTMGKDTLLEIWDPAIRPDFKQDLMDELSAMGKEQGVGPRFYQYVADQTESAGQALMGDRDLMLFMENIALYCERPIKELMLALADYAVQDGIMTPLMVPSSLDQLQIVWDWSILVDQNSEKARIMSAAGMIVSREYACRKVFNMTEEEITQNTMELLADPLMAQQMQMQNDAGKHINNSVYGALGTSMPPLQGGGNSPDSSRSKQANNSAGTEKGRATGSETKK